MTIATFHELAGCELELVPDAGIGLTGSNLTTWSDQSGHVRHATLANAIADGMTNATAPVYAASDAGFGNKPTITFNALLARSTDCLATADFGSDIVPPYAFVVAGQHRYLSAQAGRGAYRRLAALSASYADGPFYGGGDPLGADVRIWNITGATDPLEPRRVAGASMLEAPFVLAGVVRSSTYGVVAHNGRIRAARTMTAPAAGPLLRGIRLGNSSANPSGSAASCWVGPLNLVVLYSRELSTSELKDAMSLAGSKCGITWLTGRLAA